MSMLAALLVACCPQIANEDALLVDPTPLTHGGFGPALAMDGDRLVVAESGTRSVHVYEHGTSGTWIHVATLTTATPSPADAFGYSVDIDGDRIAVGVRWRDAAAVDAGSVIVFERQSSGAWLETQELFAPDAAAGDNFGFDVGVSGERIVVGAAFDDDLGTNSGSAYVFEKSGAQMVFAAKLLSPHGAAFDIAGWSVDIDGDRCVVGSQSDDSLALDVGCALVFEFDGVASWNHVVSLYGTGSSLGDRFGFDVAIDGSLVVVGAIGSNDAGVDAGAAYVFARQVNGSWNEESQLLAPTTTADDGLGVSVAIHGERIVVGAHLDDTQAFAAGSADLFARRANTTWTHEATLLHSDGKQEDQAGSKVAIGPRGIAIAAPSDDVMGVVNGGSVHVLSNGALFHGRPRVSISAPTPHNLHLRAGDAWSGATWFVGGSASGTSPGIPLGLQTVPLVYDAYTELTLALAAPLTAPIGTLDADGQGFCRFVLPSGTSPSFAGLVLHHAFVAVHPVTFELLVSNAVRVELAP
jgi:hypothetical protein